jgi:hypothetical protein
MSEHKKDHKDALKAAIGFTVVAPLALGALKKLEEALSSPKSGPKTTEPKKEEPRKFRKK